MRYLLLALLALPLLGCPPHPAGSACAKGPVVARAELRAP